MKKSDKIGLAKYAKEVVVKHCVKKNGETIDYKELMFYSIKDLKKWVDTIGDEDVYYAEVRIPIVER